MSLPGTIAEGIIERVAGPMGLRFVFQPLIGLLLGVRDGYEDAKKGEPPFIFDIIADREGRREKLASLFASLSRTITVAVLLDIIAQHIIFDQVRITSAILIAVIILTVPYSLARAVTNRIVTKRNSQKLL